jgi:hypothetical protein
MNKLVIDIDNLHSLCSTDVLTLRISIFNDEPQMLLYSITVPILISKLTHNLKQHLKPDYSIDSNFINVVGDQHNLLTLFYEIQTYLHETVSYLKEYDANMMKDCGVTSMERAKQGLVYALSLLPVELIRRAKIQKALQANWK